MKRLFHGAKSEFRNIISQSPSHQHPIQHDQVTLISDPTPADVFRYRYHYGTNLGSIYVLERWLYPSMFPSDTPLNQSSELEAVKAWGERIGVEATKQKFEEHWANAVTDEDLRWLRDVAKCRFHPSISAQRSLCSTEFLFHRGKYIPFSALTNSPRHNDPPPNWLLLALLPRPDKTHPLRSLRPNLRLYLVLHPKTNPTPPRPLHRPPPRPPRPPRRRQLRRALRHKQRHRRTLDQHQKSLCRRPVLRVSSPGNHESEIR